MYLTTGALELGTAAATLRVSLHLDGVTLLLQLVTLPDHLVDHLQAGVLPPPHTAPLVGVVLSVTRPATPQDLHLTGNHLNRRL